MSHNPNHTINWPKCWKPNYTGPSLIGWHSENPEQGRLKDLTYATQIAYEELALLENHNHET